MADASDRMPNGSYPVSTQKAANSAWKLRGRSKDYSAAQVVAHIRAMVAKHNLTMPRDAVQTAAAVPPHGFVWPDGMPPCSMCERDPNDSVHINPPKAPLNYGERIVAADKHPNPVMPVRAHAYTPSTPMITSRVMCAGCGADLANPIHAAGLPSGAPHSSNSGMWGAPSGGGPFAGPQHAQQQAFVSQIGEKLIFAAPGTVDFTRDDLPRQLAAAFERASTGSPHNLWIAGRYVEADRPNRNGAFWSTADLEVGAPSVTHGPLNYNHSEKDIIGSIVDSELVRHEREAAGVDVGNHIAALAVVWPYIHPEKANLIRRASDSQRLWFSMECTSKQVRCLAAECPTDLPYSDYMRRQESRCRHMREGMPRRFVDPIFGGGAVIVPPINPGWAHADARVMKQAAALAERQAAAFGDMPTSEAEQLVASLLQNGE